MEFDDECLVDFLKLVYEVGMEVLFVFKSEKVEYLNFVKMFLKKGIWKFLVIGILIGGGNI